MLLFLFYQLVAKRLYQMMKEWNDLLGVFRDKESMATQCNKRAIIFPSDKLNQTKFKVKTCALLYPTL